MEWTGKQNANRFAEQFQPKKRLFSELGKGFFDVRESSPALILELHMDFLFGLIAARGSGIDAFHVFESLPDFLGGPGSYFRRRQNECGRRRSTAVPVRSLGGGGRFGQVADIRFVRIEIHPHRHISVRSLAPADLSRNLDRRHLNQGRGYLSAAAPSVGMANQ